MNWQLHNQTAVTNLGSLYFEGQGVPQSYERAAELWKQSAAKGEPVSQRDQAQFHLQIFEQMSLIFTHNRPHTLYIEKKKEEDSHSNLNL